MKTVKRIKTNFRFMNPVNTLQIMNCTRWWIEFLLKLKVIVFLKIQIKNTCYLYDGRAFSANWIRWTLNYNENLNKIDVFHFENEKRVLTQI